MTAEDLDPRRQELWRLHDFGSGRGLEVGPLHDAILRRDRADVRYVDITDQAGLRAYYGNHPGIPIDDIPEIDYPLTQPDGRIASLAEATRDGSPFDWVIASHVVEHVPDLIGWLADLAEVVTEGGALVLVIPDRRYSFDAHRPPTSVGAMLEAHALGADRPGIRAVYDHYARVVHADVLDLWRGGSPTYDNRYHDLEEAQAKVAESAAGSYVDCHVWVFSPDEFAEQLHELRSIGQSAWYLDRLRPTTENTNEFMVRLRRMPRSQNPMIVVDEETGTSRDRPDWLRPELALREQVAELQVRVAALTRVNTQLERRVRRQSDRLRIKSKRLRQLRVRSRRDDPVPPPEATRPTGRIASGLARMSAKIRLR